MRLVDTHCHLYFDSYREDLKQVLDRAEQEGVERILVPGIDLESSREAVALAGSYPIIKAAVGVHPNSANTWQDGTLGELQQLTDRSEIRAVGEIGLDYYREKASRNRQIQVFQKQLELAQAAVLPVVLHVRNRSEQDRSCLQDLLDILKDWKDALPKNWIGSPGVLHSFSGNLEEAERALMMGFYLGITGPITYRNADMLRELVRNVPLDRLLVETDGPFLTPHPRRGKRNEPGYVKFVVQKIADVIDKDYSEVAARTAENADQLFSWRESL